METNRLRQFCTVFETSNLRQAAELIGMTHGALSKSIKVLELELGIQLFIAEGRGIIPTHEAAQVYKQAQNIINEVEKLTAYNQENSRHQFRIASFEVFTTYFLSLLSEDLSDMQLELHELVHGDLEQAVKDGSVEVGITYEPIPTSGVEFLPIKKIKMAPYTQDGAFKNIDTSEIPFAAPIRPVVGAPTGVKGLDGWPDHEAIRDVKFRVDMMESAIELARHGHCAIFIPEFIAGLHNQLVKKKYSLVKRAYPKGTKIVERMIYIVKRKNMVESAQMKKIGRYLRSI